MSESAPRRRWFQFGLRTMFLVMTVVAVFGSFAIYATKVESLKSTFSAKDMSVLRTAIGVPLPTGAVFHQAALVGRRDKTITVELRMPVADAKQFKASVSLLSNNPGAGYATRGYYTVYHIPQGAEIDAYYWIGEETQFIFWKPTDEVAIVTVDFVDFVSDRKIREAEGVFSWW